MTPPSTGPREVTVTLPGWVDDTVDFSTRYTTDETRMRVAIDCARENVLHNTGGPFGAAIFENDGRLVAVGVNLVVPLNSSSLHAEIVAFMMAQAAVGSYTLQHDGLPQHELFTSCEPCSMCLGAILWSGVRRVVWSASRDDAGRIAFDEGPVFNASYDYLRARGIAFSGGLLRADGQAVLRLYDARGGEIYNA